MKILLRRFDEKHYVWKESVYRDGYFRVEDNIPVYNTEILAIKDDDRKDYVRCLNCGELVKNNPESIEAHFTAQEAKRDCFKCSSLRKYSYENIKADISRSESGRLVIHETYEAELKCGQTWHNLPSIDSDEVKKICLHYRCRNMGVAPINDIFIQYPDMFDKCITVDVLNANKFEYDGHRIGYFEYDMKCRNSIKACVNELGIVDHFVIKYRHYRYTAYYSAKYDMLFFYENGNYSTRIPNNISETKYNQAKAKISALYKEEKTNE